MKILITGGAGYIGSKLTEKLSDYGYSVTVFDNLLWRQGTLVTKPMLGSRVKFYKEDIRDWSGDLNREIGRADIIIPLAALVGAPLCDRLATDAYEINQRWIQDLVPKLSSDQTIIFPNTNSSYGTCEGVCTEKTPINPLSLYAKTKQNAEDCVLTHNRSISFRLATVFGWSYRPRIDLLVNNLIYSAFINKHIDVYNGKARRNYIHIDDICSAFFYAINHTSRMYGVYNLGNDSLNSTKEDLAKYICNKMGAVITFSEGTDPDKRDYEVSSVRLEKAGFKAVNGLDVAIEEMTKFYKISEESDYKRCKNY
jgi:nucleoside-diphosphate-sugar epimerase